MNPQDKSPAEEKSIDEEFSRLGADNIDDTEDMPYLGEGDFEKSAIPTHPPETVEEAELRAEETEEAAEAAPEEPEEELTASEETKEEEAEVEEEPEDGAPDNMVPHSRFNEVNEKKKAAELRAKELEDRIKALEAANAEPEPEPEPAYDFDAKEEEYMAAVLEGDADKAKEIRSEIRTQEHKIYSMEAAQTAQDTTQMSKEQERFLDKTTELEERFPVLNDKSDDFDMETTDVVIALYEGLQKTGKYDTPEAALEAAAQQILGTQTVAEPEDTTEVEDDAATKNSDAKKKAGAKKAAAAKRQPNRMQGGTNDVDAERVGKVMEISDEEWDNLPESRKREMRGDYRT